MWRMSIQVRMAWQDFLTDEERAELDAVEGEFSRAKAALVPIKEERDATIRRLKIRCDARMRRAKADCDESRNPVQKPDGSAENE